MRGLSTTSLNLGVGSLRFQKLLIVIKQTAFEEYSQVRIYLRLTTIIWIGGLHRGDTSDLAYVPRTSYMILSSSQTIVEITRSGAEGFEVETLRTKIPGA